MKTRTFTMAALAAGAALMLSAQLQAQVVFPKVISDPTGARATIAVGSMAGLPGDTVKFTVPLTVTSISSTLSMAITDTDTTIPIADASLFPPAESDGKNVGTVKIDNEVITYTGLSGNSLTGATRGVGTFSGTMPGQCQSTSPNPGCPAAHTSGTTVTLEGVAGTQNDIEFDANAPVVEGGTCSDDGKNCITASDCAVETPAQTCDLTGAPACTVNPSIHKTATAFAYEPPGCCSTGACPGSCTNMRGIVLSTSNTTEIPTGSNLYTCSVTISAEATLGQTFPLTCSGDGVAPNASDPTGIPLSTVCTNGAISVGTLATATPTGTPTGTPTFTPGTPGTPTPVDTNTATATFTKVPTNTRGPGGRGNDDDSCAIASPANSTGGWMLLLPAAALLWIRRRSR